MPMIGGSSTKWNCADRFATVNAIMSEHRCAACGYTDAGKRIGIHLIELYQALSFLMLHSSTKLSDIGASDK